MGHILFIHPSICRHLVVSAFWLLRKHPGHRLISAPPLRLGLGFSASLGAWQRVAALQHVN